MKTKFKLLVSLMISVIMIGSQFAVLSGNVHAVENKPSLKVAILDYEPCLKEGWLYNFEVAIMKELSERMGYNIDFISKDWEDLLYTVSIGEADCAIGGFSKDSTYEDMVDFTIPYFAGEVTQTHKEGTPNHFDASFVIATKKDSNLKNQLNDAIISTVEDGTVFDLAIESGIEDSTKNIVYHNDFKIEYFMNKDLLKSKISNYMLSVKDVCFVTDNDFLVLMENGRLYKGNSIDTRNPELIAENKDSIEDTPTAPKEYAEKIKDGIKHYYPSNYTGKSDFIISNANELIAIKKNVNDFAIKTILTDVKDIIYQSYLSSLHLVILRNNGDLFCLQNIHNENQNLVRICGEVNSIDKVAIDGHYLTYIDRYDDAFYCYLNKENISPVKYHDNASEVFLGGGSGDERTLISKDGYVESFPWTTETIPRSKVYGYTKVITLAPTVMHDDFIEDIYGRCCIYNGPYTKNHVFDVYNVKKAVELKDSYLFLTEDGKLYGAFEDEDASIVGTFETIFSQKRTIVKINKKEVALKDKIQIVDGRSMYPFRECLENMGATVYYDSVNGIAVGEYNGTKIEFPINKNEYWINGNKYEMDVFSYIDASIGRTYIPIRYAAEGLGFIVDWIPGDIEDIISIHK